MRGHGEPLDGADGDEEKNDIPPEEHHQENDENGERHRIHDVDGAHHHGVELTAEESSDGAIDDADSQGDKGGGETDGERDATAEKEADEEIAAEGVGAEPMRATGGRRAEIEVLCFVAVRGKERAEEAGEGDDGEGRESEGGEFVFAEAEPSVVPEGVALFDGFVDRGGPRGDGRGAGEGRHGGLRIRGGLWGSSKPGRCRRRG